MPISESKLLVMLADPCQQQQAFGVLVKMYSETLYKQIRRIVVSHEDANDALQNAFLKAWQALPSFEGRSRLSTWLYRIAINEALALKKHNERLSSLVDDEGEETSIAHQLMADPYFDGDETAARLEECIRKLPHVQQMVFRMRYFDDMKYSDISEVLGTSEGALKASYHIAVKKISEFFDVED